MFEALAIVGCLGVVEMTGFLLIRFLMQLVRVEIALLIPTNYCVSYGSCTPRLSQGSSCKAICRTGSLDQWAIEAAQSNVVERQLRFDWVSAASRVHASRFLLRLFDLICHNGDL